MIDVLYTAFVWAFGISLGIMAAGFVGLTTIALAGWICDEKNLQGD